MPLSSGYGLLSSFLMCSLQLDCFLTVIYVLLFPGSVHSVLQEGIRRARVEYQRLVESLPMGREGMCAYVHGCGSMSTLATLMDMYG